MATRVRPARARSVRIDDRHVGFGNHAHAWDRGLLGKWRGIVDSISWLPVVYKDEGEGLERCDTTRRW
jgi:hypothetical protein